MWFTCHFQYVTEMKESANNDDLPLYLITIFLGYLVTGRQMVMVNGYLVS